MSTIPSKKKDGKVVAFKFQLCIGRDDQGIQEAFNDFLLNKKACGIAEKTCRTYSEQFAAICKYFRFKHP